MTGSDDIEFMVDIETLDTKPSAAVLSAGVLAFKGWKVLNTLHVQLPLQQQIDHGRTLSANTIRWWYMQSHEAREGSWGTKNSVSYVSRFFDALATFMVNQLSIEGIGEAFPVWAKGPQFDLSILESLADDFNMGVPWHYRSPRDIRTAMFEAGVSEDFIPTMAGIGDEFVAHHPLHDCYWQHGVLMECRRRRGVT